MTTYDMKAYDRTLLSRMFVSLIVAAIREKRKAEPVSLGTISQATGIDKAKLSRDFAGEPNWRLSTISDLLSALNMDLEVVARDRMTGIRIAPTGVVTVPQLHVDMGKRQPVPETSSEGYIERSFEKSFETRASA